MDAVRRLADDPQPVEITLSKFELWNLLSALQLAFRHPQYHGPSRDLAEKFVRQMGALLSDNDNDLRMLFEMGFQAQFDTPLD